MKCQVDGRIETGVEKDHLITEALALQQGVEITVVIEDLGHSCQKIVPMVVAPVPVVSGEMGIQWLQAMVTPEMVLGLVKLENPEPNVN